ncbi:ubiquitin-conjugating enzyme/RWD-like protein [Helicostylum pulchrum]|uniref:UBC core domain-containing protein n=1 Tax=Helicostylum pulchrum TaxID=562976 RepID=A0ABP9YD11_9FUNG|nr:ubiquitin-conjugating enzyme/RWD-like protein [Helicostylum pulchrum]
MTVLSGKAIKRIVKELESLQQTPPEDIQVLANDEDLTQIEAWIRGPDGTPYQDGYFKVRLSLDENFPDTPPKGHFITKIFHPNVSPTGEICVNTLKKDWKPELGIEHVLLTIKCLLIVPNAESALNEEAGKLLLEQYNDYAKRARLYTSIQAKGGKPEFLQMEKERSMDTSKENATPSVLKPISELKRQGEGSSTEEKQVKKVKKSIVKKKALRRL